VREGREREREEEGEREEREGERKGELMLASFPHDRISLILCLVILGRESERVRE
jgi:hypothetical protein